jgi:hypothetical protein
MALGIHFALDPATEKQMLAAVGDDKAVLALVEHIEETWSDRLTCHHEQTWDPLHRCLGNGTLEYDSGGYPLGAAVLGGRQLIQGERDYTVSYLTGDQVREVAQALDIIEEEWFRQRYYRLHETDYHGPVDEEDLDQTWADFEDTREFFDRAAEANHAVIFTLDA